MLFIARVIRIAASAAVAFLVVGIVIHLFDISTQPAAIEFIENVGAALASPFEGIFTFDDEKARTAADWGLAALVYGIAGSVLASLIVRARAGIGFRRRRRGPAV